MRIISIEANIGAGKTHLLEQLAKRYKDRVLCLFEPIGAWEKICDENGVNMLKKYYADPKRWSFAFQVMAFSTRLKAFLEAVKLNKIIIMERSLVSDCRIFAQMLCDTKVMEPCEFEIYKMVSGDYGILDGIIWLTVPPEKCLQRIKHRAREGESEIDLNYLESIDLYHRKWLQPLDVLQVDDSDSLSEDYWLKLDAYIF